MTMDNCIAFDQTTGLLVLDIIKGQILGFGLMLDRWDKITFLLVEVEDG